MSLDLPSVLPIARRSLRGVWHSLFWSVWIAVALALGCSSGASLPPDVGAESSPDDSAGAVPPTAEGGEGSPAKPVDPGPDTLLEPDETDTATPDGPEVFYSSVRLEPATATLELSLPGPPASLGFRVFAELVGGGELDITDSAVFSVVENHLVGNFENFGSEFVTAATDPRGGVVTLQAQATDSTGAILSADGTLDVRILATLPDPGGDAASAEAAGTALDAAANAPQMGIAPELIYPSPNTLLPPNIRRLEVHFTAGTHQYYEVELSGPYGQVSYRSACSQRVGEGCILNVDDAGYLYFAESNRGQLTQITIRGTDAAGSYLASSAEAPLRFADDDVRGGLYYWTVGGVTSTNQIVRFEFGSLQTAPEAFLGGGSAGVDGCVGCHVISRDGTKMAASVGAISQVLVKDMSKPLTDPGFADEDGQGYAFGSFDPTGTRLAVVDATAGTQLVIRDAATGVAVPGAAIALPYQPQHPEWSPKGGSILLAAQDAAVPIPETIDGAVARFCVRCGISLLTEDPMGWKDSVVLPSEMDKSRYSPSFTPDADVFLFTESQCDASGDHTCDANTDPTATTWAALPAPNATPVKLAIAGAQGPLDASPDLTDTFARVSPFVGSFQGKRIVWVTISSRRAAGYREKADQLLWMFALDTEQVKAGLDGSSPAFFLPFQDLTTSNHIAQWTERIVSANPPPKPPPPGAPPAAPPPKPPQAK